MSAALSGWASDRLGRRKVFVGGSTALFAVGLVVLAHADTVTGFYVAEVVMGFAYGIYSAIDTALVVDVLPNADRPGKDLGVINIANALPQSLAPAISLFFPVDRERARRQLHAHVLGRRGGRPAGRPRGHPDQAGR